jgi:hypothetical protein
VSGWPEPSLRRRRGLVLPGFQRWLLWRRYSFAARAMTGPGLAPALVCRLARPVLSSRSIPFPPPQVSLKHALSKQQGPLVHSLTLRQVPEGKVQGIGRILSDCQFLAVFSVGLYPTHDAEHDKHAQGHGNPQRSIPVWPPPHPTSGRSKVPDQHHEKAC